MTKLIATAGACLAVGICWLRGRVGLTASWPDTRPAASSAPRRTALVVAEDVAAIEAKLLQGTWQGVEIEKDGRRFAAAESRELPHGVQGR